EPTRRGLIGTYTADANLNKLFDDNAGTNIRVDPQVSMNWGTTAPYPSVGAVNFLVHWDGYVTVPTAGAWYFGAASDDGVRVYINGIRVLDRWIDQGGYNSPPVYGTSTTFSAGQTLSIKVEYYEHTASAGIRLAMKGPGVANDT